jgi:hypothetical protein
LIRNVPDGIMFNIVVFDSAVHEVLPVTQLQPVMDRERLVDQFRHTMRMLKIFGGTRRCHCYLASHQITIAVGGNVSRLWHIFLQMDRIPSLKSALAAAVKQASDLHITSCAYGFGQDWTPEVLVKMAQITRVGCLKPYPILRICLRNLTAWSLAWRTLLPVMSPFSCWTPAGANILSSIASLPRLGQR